MAAPELTEPVLSAYSAFPPAARKKLLTVRRLIFATAAKDPVIGPITETLKWGQPSYLTEQSRSGSTVRLGLQDGTCAIFFHCQTSLVDSFRTRFPELEYVGNRMVVVDAKKALPKAALSECIHSALTYHRHKHKKKPPKK